VSGKVIKIHRDGGKPVHVEVHIRKIEAEVISSNLLFLFNFEFKFGNF